MELIKYPNPILLTKSEDVELTDEVKKFISDMLWFYQYELKWGNPVGLAAPQVGKNWNIFIALDEVFINPKITWLPTNGWSTEKEGCYSLEKDRYDYEVRRAYSVRLEWIDITGEKHQKKFNGFKAQVIQHEYDHLQGLLCCGKIDL